MEKPYLSIVATTRNDNHGGDLIKRTEAFMRSVYYQAAKWNLPTELIIVEWNPPADKALLHTVLPKPPANGAVKLKYILVPEELHKQYNSSASIPLYQMIAKNVGIQRAEGEFILCTNIDIVFSDELFKELQKRQLQKGVFYRANRCDVPRETMAYTDHSEQLAYANKNIISRLGKTQGHETLRLPRWTYAFTRLVFLLNRIALEGWKVVNPGKYPHFLLDFMACGDFTLMSRHDWMDIEGYVELDMYSIHIDSLALWSAVAAGKKQFIFPYNACVYHIYHEDGWESNDVLKTIRFLENKPCLDYSLVHKAGMQAIEKQQAIKLNKPNWGFADFDLQTFEF
jgi:hypothetical protein